MCLCSLPTPHAARQQRSCSSTQTSRSHCTHCVCWSPSMQQSSSCSSLIGCSLTLVRIWYCLCVSVAAVVHACKTSCMAHTTASRCPAFVLLLFLFRCPSRQPLHCSGQLPGRTQGERRGDQLFVSQAGARAGCRQARMGTLLTLPVLVCAELRRV
jgi:hypothetical protein